MPDPLDALVYGLPALLSPSRRADAAAIRNAITTRLRLFAGVAAGLA